MMLPGRDRCHGEKIMDRGSVYRRCGCRDKATGRLLGARCPGLRSREHGSWCFSADLPSATGERHRVRRGGFATQDAASAALEALASPAAGPEPGLSTGEWLSRWLESRVSLRASTSRSYAAHVRSYLVPYLGGIPLAALTAGDVQAMFTAVIRNEGALGLFSSDQLRSCALPEPAGKAAKQTDCAMMHGQTERQPMRHERHRRGRSRRTRPLATVPQTGRSATRHNTGICA
jgi:hypothetical protein